MWAFWWMQGTLPLLQEQHPLSWPGCSHPGPLCLSAPSNHERCFPRQPVTYLQKKAGDTVALCSLGLNLASSSNGWGEDQKQETSAPRILYLWEGNHNSPCLSELLKEMKEAVIRYTFSASQMQLNLLGTVVLALKLFVYIQILLVLKVQQKSRLLKALPYFSESEFLPKRYIQKNCQNVRYTHWFKVLKDKPC